jgi:hypothetical protein
MITYSDIGHFGRCGNQMFQFAATYGIAKKLGYEVYFPLENSKIPSIEDFKDGITREVYFDLPRIFEIPEQLLKNRGDISTSYTVQEPHFHFTEQLFSIPDNCDLRGYYQTEKYFEHCKQDVLDLFTFKSQIKSEAIEKMPITNCDRVSIHIRLGDYVGLQQFHPVCDSEYYFHASQNFKDDVYHFLIFSDNIDYCKDMFGESENISYIEGNTAEVDMCMMSMCEHNIIANSSFSWWAAWLNTNPFKKVIAPKKWFGPAYDGINDTKDLYCQNWIIV